MAHRDPHQLERGETVAPGATSGAATNRSNRHEYLIRDLSLLDRAAAALRREANLLDESRTRAPEPGCTRESYLN